MQKGRRRSVCPAAAALMACLYTVCAAGQSAPVPAGSQQGSCSLPGLAVDAGKTPRADDLLRAYNAQVALIHSLRGPLILHIRDTAGQGGKRKKAQTLPAMLSFRAPASVRLTGMAPFSGRQTFDLASDGREFEMLVPGGKAMRFFAGPADEPVSLANLKENIGPETIVEALGGIPVKPGAAAVPTPGESDATAALNVEMATSKSRTVDVRLEFDLRAGTLARLAIPALQGNSATEVDYNDWRRVPDERQRGKFVCFPTRIYIVQPQQSRQIELKFLSIEMNGPVLASQFRFFVPPGVAVTRIGGIADKSAPQP